MRVPWYQHDSNSLRSGDIFDGMRKFGDCAYVVYFGLLEIMSNNFDPYNPGRSVVSRAVIERDLDRPWAKIEPVLRFFCGRGRFNFRRRTVQGVEMIELKNNKYKDTMGEYSKKIIRNLSEENSK